MHPWVHGFPTVSNEVLKNDVFDCPGPAVRFDHVHLVARPGIYVLVRDGSVVV